jgi:hypothetical protein
MSTHSVLEAILRRYENISHKLPNVNNRFPANGDFRQRRNGCNAHSTQNPFEMASHVAVCMAEPVGLEPIVVILRVTLLEVTTFAECNKLARLNFTAHEFVFFQ